jgi:ribosomal protein S18 acetylase RimI-like enzyme
LSEHAKEESMPENDAVSDNTIRPARQADLPDLLDLYRHLSPDDPAPEPTRAEDAWTRTLASNLVTVFVAERGTELVAACTLAILPNLTRNARSIGWIENVVTRREYRRLGFGSRLLAVALQAASNAGCYKVMLATGSDDEATLRFYRAAGFRQGGKTFFEFRPS